MELKKILDVRRSTRKFLDRKVEQEKLQRIVDICSKSSFLSTIIRRVERELRDEGAVRAISAMR